MNMEFMKEALNLAKIAKEKDEVPIGAVVVKNDQIIGKGYNMVETLKDPTAHAEMIAIKDACNNIGEKRLIDCDLYVTIEPCIMCAGAIWQSRIKNVYYGAPDPKGGALDTLYNIGKDTRLNHRFTSKGFILEEDSRNLIQLFFREKRTGRGARVV